MKRIALASVTISVLILLVFIVVQVMQFEAKKVQASGTQHAISGAIQTEVSTTNSSIAVLIQKALGTNEIIELSTNQYDAIIDILVSHKAQLDVLNSWKPGMTLNDPWGNRFRIIVQRTFTDWPPTITVTNHKR